MKQIMKNMNVSELKKKLKSKTQKELIDDIATLFKSFDVVKEYYQVQSYIKWLTLKHNKANEAGPGIARDSR